ncbi:MAG TPA: hypothetical protein VM925_09175 [Labilithrix sp.]|nr:hypothetical protein [Labilithrix sp.]
MARNLEDHGRPTFKTVLHDARRADAAAIARASKKMFEAREKRPKPFRDEKILTSWSWLARSEARRVPETGRLREGEITGRARNNPASCGDILVERMTAVETVAPTVPAAITLGR